MPYYFSRAQRKAGLLPAAPSVCLLHPYVGTVAREGAEPTGLTWPWPKYFPFLQLQIQQPPRSRGPQEPCRMIKAFGTCTLLEINPCGQEENLPGAWEEALVSARAKPAPACPQTPAGGTWQHQGRHGPISPSDWKPEPQGSEGPCRKAIFPQKLHAEFSTRCVTARARWINPSWNCSASVFEQLSPFRFVFPVRLLPALLSPPF